MHNGLPNQQTISLDGTERADPIMPFFILDPNVEFVMCAHK